MKKIILNRVHKPSPNYKKYFALVDDEDFERVRDYNWHIKKSLNTIYAIAHINKKLIRLHNFIMGYIGIDHIDGNGLNNQRHNLRKATKQENMRNMKPNKNTSSKFKGVHWDKRTGKWMAQIKYNSKVTYLGRFTSELEAAKKYNKHAKKHFGEFAKLNKL